jgi:dienelactone hydrolase
MNKLADIGILSFLSVFMLSSCSFGKLAPNNTPVSPNTSITETFIYTKDNLSLSVKYFIPQSQEKPPVVILLHQFRKDKTSWDEFIPDLLKNGYAVYAIDMRGHGKSNKFKDGREIFYETMPESDWNQVSNDVHSVIEFVKTNSAVDSSKIGVIGASIGANTAIMASSLFSDEIKTAVALSPGIEYHHLKTYDYAKNLKNPLMMAVANNDAYAFESSNELDKVIKSKHALNVYEGAEHGTNLLNITPDLQNKIVVWLNENLKK